MGFEIRVPRAMTPGRLWPAGVRPFRNSSGATDRREAEPGNPPPPREEDVELAVRERLYGTRAHAR
jgi:hypothetical protein